LPKYIVIEFVEVLFMSRKNKILYGILALIFSLGATGLGFILLGNSSLDFIERFIYGFFFMMQFVSSAWLVITVFRKTK